MSGETDADKSSWTPDLLKIHLQQEIDRLASRLDERQVASKELFDAELAAMREAVSIVAKNNETRFAENNEFRAQLRDQAGTFIPRTEVEAMFRSLGDKADAEATRNAERLREVNKRLDLSQGSDAATRRMILYGFTALGIVISVVVFLANYLSNRN